MRVLFLVTARGGSKGLLGKNLAEVGGIPLVGRSVRVASLAARALRLSNCVVCSTDDPAIAELARAWGAEVPFLRPAELASDEAKAIDVVLHALGQLPSFDTVVLLQPTSPLTAVDDVLGALALFEGGRDPVVSICRAEHPAEWLFRLTDAGLLRSLSGWEGLVARRQDAAVHFRPNGAIYVSGVEALRRDRTFFGEETRGFVMPGSRSIDVDCAEDLEIARAQIASWPVPRVEIGGLRIGPGSRCFVIAEAGVNHNGDVGAAFQLVDAAAEAGADAVKFQTFRAERLVTRNAPKADYQIRATGTVESQYEMLRRLELDEADYRKLQERCSRRGVLFLSTPFDEESCDLLDSLGVPAFKLPSGELTNLPLLRHAARKGKPLIVSTGMATLEETAVAVDAIHAEGARDLVLLHCVSNYPADPADANLRAMTTLKEAFGVPTGFSDHTEGDAVALAAVAMGASVLEKHFTLDRGLPGPDHQASIEPPALRELVRRVRDVEAALGHGRKEPAASEAAIARVARKSLVAGRRIPAGTVLEREMIVARRPGTGLPPDQFDLVVGRTARSDILEGTVLQMDMLS